MAVKTWYLRRRGQPKGKEYIKINREDLPEILARYKAGETWAELVICYDANPWDFGEMIRDMIREDPAWGKAIDARAEARRQARAEQAAREEAEARAEKAARAARRARKARRARAQEKKTDPDSPYQRSFKKKVAGEDTLFCDSEFLVTITGKPVEPVQAPEPDLSDR